MISDIIKKSIELKENILLDTSLHTMIYNSIDVIVNSFQLGNKVMFCGNGGSAATSSHFAIDLGVGTMKLGKLPIKSISLADNLSTITAIANDLDFSKVFEKQIEVLGKPGDLLILISASGNSKNLINALNLAVQKEMKVFTLTGFDGGELKLLSSGSNIHIPSMVGEYGLVEDLHLSICHMATECIRAIND
jgi:D-sedoheptulose 7-phosphate isomerase